MQSQEEAIFEIAASLSVVSQQLAANTAILAFVIAAIRNTDLDTDEVAKGLKLLSLIEPVQTRVNTFADALTYAGQYKPTNSSFHVIDGGKDDPESGDDAT